jgi:hypothetical protein
MVRGRWQLQLPQRSRCVTGYAAGPLSRSCGKLMILRSVWSVMLRMWY